LQTGGAAHTTSELIKTNACTFAPVLFKLEKASTHDSAKTHAGNVLFVIRDLDL